MLLSPQHTTPPAADTAQVWYIPADSVNRPARRTSLQTLIALACRSRRPASAPRRESGAGEGWAATPSPVLLPRGMPTSAPTRESGAGERWAARTAPTAKMK